MSRLVDCRLDQPMAVLAKEPTARPRRINRSPELAIVVPTLNERANVPILVDRLNAVLSEISWEAIFVDDDSSDGTAEIVHQIARGRDNIRCIRRVGRRGLSSACVDGARSTAAPYIAVIDADLQHDERLLPQMLATIKTRGLDVVVASRYLAEDGTGDWQRWRVLLSAFAERLARCVVRAELTDPMSGFFLVERNAFAVALPHLSGRGFKILIDIFASSPRPLAFAELPYRFRRRAHGQSKLDGWVAWDYLALLLDKLVGRMPAIRFVLFAAIGGIGVCVHLAVLRLALDVPGVGFAAAQAMAAVAGTTGNFLLNNSITYHDRGLHGRALMRGLFGFYAVCAAGAAANIVIASQLFAGGWRWWLAGIGGAAVSAVWNYAVSAALVWRSDTPSRSRLSAAHTPISAPAQPASSTFLAD